MCLKQDQMRKEQRKPVKKKKNHKNISQSDTEQNKIRAKLNKHGLPDKKKLICISMAVVLAAGGTVYGGTRWYLNSHTSKTMNEMAAGMMEMQVQKGNLTLGTTVSGTTQAGSAYQNFLLSFLEQSGYLPVVEEVYAVAGDTVEEGTALYKITADSITNIEEYLDEVIKEAQKSYKEAKLQYASDLLEAETEYATNKNLAGTASENYNSTVKSLSLEVESTKESYEEAKTIIAENPDKISTKEETIQSLKAKVTSLEKSIKILQSKADTKAEKESKALEELQQAEQEKKLADNLYQNAKQYLEKVQGQSSKGKLQSAELKSGEVQVTSDSVQRKTVNQQSEKTDDRQESVTADSTVMESYIAELKEHAAAAKKNYESKKSTYEKVKTSSENAAAKLEAKQTALSKTENSLVTAEQQLETFEAELKNAENNIDTLKAAYDKAAVAQDTDKVTAKQEYENSVLTYDYAEVIFQSEKDSLDEQLNVAKEEVETMESYLKQWKEWIGNGVITASRAGELTFVGYEADTYISGMIPLVTYYDGDVLSVDVTVDQKDIGYISVGETVNVSLNGAFVEGTVAAIATERAESGASKVNYTVTVNIENTEGAYTTGQTAEITFVKEELENVLYAPKQMVLEDSKGSYVWLKNGDGKEKVYVQTGESNDSYVVITSGLEEGRTCVYVEEEQDEEEN